MKKENKLALVLCLLAATLIGQHTAAQYEENPLKNRRWATLTAGLVTMDNISWQINGTYAKRSDFILTEARLAYTQEFIESADDSCTSIKNRLCEVNLMWGDGWGGKKWFVSGSLGFAINVRMYCDIGDYENRYITAVNPGFAAQISGGVWLGPHFGLCFSGTGNLNFTAPYYGANFGICYQFNKIKEPKTNP